MGNMCVTRSGMANQVHSPDRASSSSGGNNGITPDQLISARHALSEVAGLPRDVHSFISSHNAPADLRDRHNTLFRNTRTVLDAVDIHDRSVRGDISAISDTTSDQLMSSIQSLRSKLDGLRAELQRAMPARASSEQYRVAVQPGGARQLSSLTPSPYRN
ncbi:MULTISPECIES: type III effector [Pseudomonas syringae group]|uniref:type III effector n=2 Tax=Pseudomonas TaxID=286 RepID=UPI0009BEC90E|nr:type III effector [Pseudomonas coronafaciens]